MKLDTSVESGPGSNSFSTSTAIGAHHRVSGRPAGGGYADLLYKRMPGGAIGARSGFIIVA